MQHALTRPSTATPASPFPARCAVSTLFFINGVVLASWVPHIPAVKARHAISDGQLGIILLSMAVGSVFALPLAGWLINRFGSRRMVTIAALGFCLILPLLILSPSAGLLAGSLVLFGACNGILDVSMNAQAVAVEQHYDHPIMSSFHGLFSLGGLTGAGVAGLGMSLSVGDVQHVTTVMLLAVLAVLSVLRWLMPSSLHQDSPSPTFVKPQGTLLSLGVLAFFALLIEGAMADWSAVYLHDVLHTDSAIAAAGFAACSLMMAVGRFAGDWLANRFSSWRLLQVSGALAALGLGAGLVIATPVPAIVGFGMVGLGVANMIPILFSAAGKTQGVQPGTALSAVASMGYFGFLIGPPLIGLVAEVTSLPVALGIVSVCCAIVAVRASAIGKSLQMRAGNGLQPYPGLRQSRPFTESEEKQVTTES